MVELKDCQQLETGGELQFLMPDFDGTRVPIFESLYLEGLYVADLLHHELNCVVVSVHS